MAEHIVRTTVSQPQQARSREALARLFSSTSVLLESETFDRLSVEQIAAAADLSVGSIYQRFKTKDDLLWALYEEYIVTAERRFKETIEAGEAANLREQVVGLIDLVCGLFRSERGVVRSLLLKYRENANDIPESFLRRIEAAYASAAQSLTGDGSPVSQNRARFAVTLIVAACREEILFGDTRRLTKLRGGRREFERMLCDATLGVLEVTGDG